MAVSHSTAADITAHLNILPELIRVVHPGVDAAFGPPPSSYARTKLRRRFEIRNNPALLHVGNNWFYKNLEGLLHAFALVRQEKPDAVLVRVAGRRPDNVEIV